MKAKSGTTPITESQVISGIQYTLNIATGVITAKKEPDNRKTKSPTFHGMNNAIINLDSVFNVLPPSGPSGGPYQSSWDLAALSFATVTVCGCDLESINGQKLYRLVNYWNLVAGFPPAQSPPTIPALNPNGLISCQVITDPTDPNHGVYMASSLQPVDSGFIWQIGKGLYNPVTQVPAMTPNYVIPAADFMYSYMLGLPDLSPIKFCSFTKSGLPIAGNAEAVVIHF